MTCPSHTLKATDVLMKGQVKEGDDIYDSSYDPGDLVTSFLVWNNQSAQGRK